MKKPADLAILAIGVYVIHQIVLSAILLDYVSFTDSLKWFTPIGPLQEDYDGKFFDVLGGIINLALVGTMIFLIVARSKDSGSTRGNSLESFGAPASTSKQ
jgi:hypothetical protein